MSGKTADFFDAFILFYFSENRYSSFGKVTYLKVPVFFTSNHLAIFQKDPATFIFGTEAGIGYFKLRLQPDLLLFPTIMISHEKEFLYSRSDNAYFFCHFLSD
jgi:hypothetical protein